MTISEISLTLLFLAFIACIVGSETGRWINRSVALILLLIVVFLGVASWIYAIREYQTKPHRITTSIGGQILSEHWTTNPCYVTFKYETKPTSNGLTVVTVPVTNEYWHVWSIFKK